MPPVYNVVFDNHLVYLQYNRPIFFLIFQTNTFQAVIGTNGSTSFAIFNYGEINEIVDGFTQVQKYTSIIVKGEVLDKLQTNCIE